MDYMDEQEDGRYDGYSDYAQNSVVSGRLVLTVLFAALANRGMYLSFCQAYGYPVAGINFMVIIFCSVLFTVIFSLPKRKCVISCVIVFAVFLIRILVNYPNIQKQANDIFLYIQDRASVYYNYSSPVYLQNVVTVQDDLSGQALIVSILFISIALMIFSVMGGTRFVTVLLMVSVLCADMFYGKTPDIRTAFCIFVSAVALCGIAQLKNSNNSRFLGFGRYSFMPFVVLMVITLVSIFFGAIMQSAMGGGILSKRGKFYEIQSKVEIKAQEIATDIVGSFKLNKDRDRLNNSPPFQIGRKILTVRADKMPVNSIYLREKSCDTYNDNEWSTQIDYVLEDGDALKLFSKNYDVVEQIVMMNLKNAEGILNAEDRHKIQKIKVELEYFQTDSNFMFPYWADIEGAVLDGSEGGSILSGGNDREILCSGDSFSLNIYDIGEHAERTLLNQHHSNLSNSKLNDDYGTHAKRHYEDYPNNLAGLDGFAKKVKTVGSLGGVLSLYGRQCGLIREEIWDNVSYSKKLSRLPSGEDFTEHFLLSQKKGYCVHYATAGTLLCRMKNMPARYVTGYRVDPSGFKKINGRDGNPYYVADVLDTSGHAWTEVYKQNLGWVPVEMTEMEDFGNYNPDEFDDSSYEPDGDDMQPDTDDGENSNNGDDAVTLPDTDDSNNDDDDADANGEDTDDNDNDADDNVSGIFPDGNGGDDANGTDGNDGTVSGVSKDSETDESVLIRKLTIIFSVAAILYMIIFLARHIAGQRKIKAQKEYESFDRSRKLLVRTAKLGKRCAKSVKLKYKTLDDGSLLSVFMRVGDGEITKREIEVLGNILERSAFAEHEISEELFKQAERTLDKVEGKVMPQSDS